MKQATRQNGLFRQIAPGLSVATLIGLAAYGLARLLHSPVADPLIVALVVGIVIRTAIGGRETLRVGFAAAPSICLPAGIAFYAVKNLNFVKFAETPPRSIVLAILVVVVYFATILILGRCLRQKLQISCLAAAGSAICGASAIAITAPAVKAKADDISISLLAVTVAAIVALFTFLPFAATTLDMSDQSYGMLSGSVLQITGFVKSAVHNLPFLSREISDKELVSLALSLKAARYLGLLVAIPLFASLVQKRLYIPVVMWIFLAAGVFGTGLYVVYPRFYAAELIPCVEPLYNISWSVAMAAIGLNADARELLSNQGAKALVMTLVGCLAAIATFFIGAAMMGYVWGKG